ncbi:MAG: hypothetical protein Q8L28_00560 [bacterium]|nr:hypothetical protein [bacterium]
MAVEVQDVYLQKFSLNKLPIRELSSYSPYDNFQTIEVSIQNIVLNKLLPDFWSIVQTPNARIHADPDRRRIVIPPEFDCSPGSMFSLLHEFGHAIQDETKSEDAIEEEKNLRSKYCYGGSASLTGAEKERFKILVVDSEKRAWNWAINTIIQYRNTNMDLTPSLSEVCLKKISDKKLATYLE